MGSSGLGRCFAFPDRQWSLHLSSSTASAAVMRGSEGFRKKNGAAAESRNVQDSEGSSFFSHNVTILG